MLRTQLSESASSEHSLGGKMLISVANEILHSYKGVKE